MPQNPHCSICGLFREGQCTGSVKFKNESSLALRVLQYVLDKKLALMDALKAHMGADFFPEGGKNASKFVIPPWL